MVGNVRIQAPTLPGEIVSGSAVNPAADGRNDAGVGGAAGAPATTALHDGGENLNRHTEEDFCPVFIPSKARYHSERGTVSLLIQDKVPFTLVVQPEELTLYERLVDRLVRRWWGEGHGDGPGGGRGGANGDSGSGGPRFLAPRQGSQRESPGPLLEPVSARPCTPPPPPPLPQDRDASHVRRLVKIHPLPLSDQGVSYVRNYILTELVPKALATSSSSAVGAAQWFWVMDDDIQRFYMAWDDKNHVITPRQLFTEVYTRIQELHGSVCDMNDVAIFSLEYPRFAYTYGCSDLALNSYNNIASLFRYDLMPPDCRYRFRIREDYDYTLQLISHGLKTARFRNLSFEVPGMAEMAGGMTNYYKTQKEDIRLQNKLFVETWPAVAQECIKGKGALQREDIRVRWDLLHPKKNPDPSATLRCRTPLQTRAHKTLPRGVGGTESAAKKGPAQTPTKTGTGSLGDKRHRASDAAREAKKQKNEGQNPTRTPANGGTRRPPGWKGYALERWRYLTVHEAGRLHLRVIPPEQLRVGQTVAVVPPLFDQNPSVVEAVLIDKKVVRRRQREKADAGADAVVEWSAVARGLPLLYVTRCYEVPVAGVAVAAAAVDAFFQQEPETKEGEGEGEDEGVV